MAPVEACAVAEIRRESVVHAEQDGASIQEPSLVASRVARDVEGVPWPIRVDHEGRDPRSHRAESRGRNDVRLSGNRESSRGIKTEPSPHRGTAGRSSSGVEDLSFVYRPSTNVGSDHRIGIQKRAEISRLERVSGRGVAEAGENAGA